MKDDKSFHLKLISLEKDLNNKKISPDEFRRLVRSLSVERSFELAKQSKGNNKKTELKWEDIDWAKINELDGLGL